jgi:hypothetical protein
MKKMTAFLTGIMLLLTCTVLPVSAAKHTFTRDLSIEECEKIEEGSKGAYMVENGVYYSASEHPLMMFDPYIPGPGTVDHVDMLQSLARLHPDAKFAVMIESYVDYPGYGHEQLRPFMDSHKVSNGMTFTEYYEAYAHLDPSNEEEKQKLDELQPYYEEMASAVNAYLNEEYVPEIRKQEAEQLAKYGITLPARNALTGDTDQNCILTAEQVLEFPGHEQCGYFMGLAPHPDNVPKQPELILGDSNTDGTVDIMDVIFLNKYVLGTNHLTDRQRQCADVNRDEVLDAGDALNILKFVVGNISSFEEIIQEPKEEALTFDGYNDFATKYKEQYGVDPFSFPEYEDYIFSIANIDLEKNRYKLVLKTFSGNMKYVCPEEGCLITFTVEFQGEYSDYDKFLAAYEKMSQKIENISENRDLILMDDGSVYLCGKMPGREQVFIIEVAGLTDNEEGRERLLRIAEKLGL